MRQANGWREAKKRSHAPLTGASTVPLMHIVKELSPLRSVRRAAASVILTISTVFSATALTALSSGLITSSVVLVTSWHLEVEGNGSSTVR